MNSPIIDSTPVSSAGRPDTVVPSTTSVRPVIRPSTMPHAACTRMFIVTPRCRDNSVNRAVSPPGNGMTTSSGTTGTRAGSAGATKVGPSIPARSSRQRRRATSLS